MRLRGPDDEGVWASSNGRAWLGHRRLSIVDLSAAGHQPMVNEDRSKHLVCNGEIYNYPALRSRLEALGHRFASRSDSETILHAYEQWGDACVEQLEGMFAFILWDETEQRVLVGRDRLGIKPLVYAEREGTLCLASECGALLPLLQRRPALDPNAVAYVMTLGYVPEPYTIWQGIRKLPPGHVLTWSPGRPVNVREYWHPPEELRDAAAGAEEWETLFHTVLREHLLADVPIGLFLSGGLDSSAVAAGLHALGYNATALCVSFPGSQFDESGIAGEVAQRCGLPFRAVPLRADDVDALIGKVVAEFDEPQGYSALLSMDLVSGAAAESSKVVLTGDGGDEVFGGYTWYKDCDQPRMVARHPSLRGLWRSLRSRRDESRAARVERFRARSVLHRHAWNVYPRFLPDEAAAVLAPTGLRFSEDTMLAPFQRHFRPDLPLQRAMQRVDLMTFCTDSILAKVDRASMAHSLEVRVPLLDRRIVEWGLSLPFSGDERQQSKPVLRRYLAPRVPATVLSHPKQGFSLRVLDGFDWARARQTVNRGFWVSSGMWSDAWSGLVAEGETGWEGRLWNLYLLTRWADAWIK